MMITERRRQLLPELRAKVVLHKGRNALVRNGSAAVRGGQGRMCRTGVRMRMRIRIRSSSIIQCGWNGRVHRGKERENRLGHVSTENAAVGLEQVTARGQQRRLRGCCWCQLELVVVVRAVLARTSTTRSADHLARFFLSRRHTGICSQCLLCVCVRVRCCTFKTRKNQISNIKYPTCDL